MGSSLLLGMVGGGSGATRVMLVFALPMPMIVVAPSGTALLTPAVTVKT